MKPLVICFEGLGLSLPGFNSWYISEELMPKVAAEVTDWRIFSWSESPNISLAELSPLKGRKIICIGHSFGGPSALGFGTLVLAKSIITLDPRSWTCDLPWAAPFAAPSGIPTYNFFREGFMPGYKVEGATNFQIYPDCGHTQVPAQPEVLDCLLRLIHE